MALSQAHAQGHALKWRPGVALTTRADHQQRQASLAAVRSCLRSTGKLGLCHPPTSPPRHTLAMLPCTLSPCRAGLIPAGQAAAYAHLLHTSGSTVAAAKHHRHCAYIHTTERVDHTPRIVQSRVQGSLRRWQLSYSIPRKRPRRSACTRGCARTPRQAVRAGAGELQHGGACGLGHSASAGATRRLHPPRRTHKATQQRRHRRARARYAGL